MFQRLPLSIHGALALGSFAVQQFALKTVNARYVRSEHPVSFAQGQTSFDAGAIKGWYAAMEAGGTMEIYVQTQLIDFGFIASMMLFGVLVGSFLARIAWQKGIARLLGLAAAVLVPMGAGFDVIENLISFVMLADSQGFADWIALPYSGFAVAKFAAIGAGYMGLLASVVINLPERLWRRRAV